MSQTTIALRKLGKYGPEIPALGFGLMGLSYSVYGSIPTEEEQFRILDRAWELGARNWDTSEYVFSFRHTENFGEKYVDPHSLYGDSEALLNKWFKRTGKRNDIFLASKFGFIKGSPRYEIDSSGDYCKKACEESLRLLGIESIDLCRLLPLN